MTHKKIQPKETNIPIEQIEGEGTGTNMLSAGLENYNLPVGPQEPEPVKTLFEVQVEAIQKLTEDITAEWLKTKARLGGDEQLVYDKAELESVQDTKGPVKDLIQTRNDLYKLFGDIQNYNNNPLI